MHCKGDHVTHERQASAHVQHDLRCMQVQCKREATERPAATDQARHARNVIPSGRAEKLHSHVCARVPAQPSHPCLLYTSPSPRD
eukprot:4305454-Alexandrium_andersonii.AAC.1